jgi:hypothetical protein
MFKTKLNEKKKKKSSAAERRLLEYIISTISTVDPTPSLG